MKCRKLTLWLHKPYKMAELKEGRHSLYLGNYWDFHAGCHGAEMLFADGTILDFGKEWTEEVRSPVAVLHMVAQRIGAETEIKYRKTPIDC